MAQSGITAAGGDATGEGGTLSYSLGQVAYTTIQANNGLISQGVQQSFEIIPLFTVQSDDDLFATLYPNPSANHVTVAWNRPIQEQMAVKVISATGQEMYQSTLTNQFSQLPLDALAAGVYFIYVRQDESLIQLFKFIKQR